MTFKEKRIKWKESAKKTLKKQYIVLVILCFIASWMGISYTSSISAFNISGTDFSLSIIDSDMFDNVDSVFSNIVNGDEKKAQKDAEETIEEQEKDNKKFYGLELGHAKGSLASIVNEITSGNILVVLYNSIVSITGSNSAALGIFIVLSFTVVFAAWFLIVNGFRVIFKRFFLEYRLYNKVPLSRITFLARTKTWIQASTTMLRYLIRHYLWCLTIIGGIIKYFSYFAIPYIVAENPSMKSKDVIKLSRDMMNGHKWELFKLYFSFIGWDILNVLSFGILGIFFVNPYIESTLSEYYSYIRTQAKAKSITNTDLLNDIYLFELPEKADVIDAYEDIVDKIQENPEIEPTYSSKVARFFAKNLGLVLKHDKTEDLYRKYKAARHEVKVYKSVLKGDAYPMRMYPINAKDKTQKIEKYLYLRHYSVPTAVLMFFIFSFIGWCWEVSIHLVEDGVFINRGTMHGPWLPIYGFGGILVLVFLFRLRGNIKAQFISTMALCGVVEYYASLYLEIAHDGMKWWDYSHYFLNLNGRICAEGLLVFAIGGVCVVYFVAPMLDNHIRKIPYKVQVIIATVLVVAFVADAIYSAKVPNVGKGITDYASNIISTYIHCA